MTICPICLCLVELETRCIFCFFPTLMSSYNTGVGYTLFPGFNYAEPTPDPVPPPPPYSPRDVVSACPVVVSDPPRVCPICLRDDMYVGIRPEKCRHMFHGICLERWLEKDMTCPVCRARLDSPPACLL